MFLGQPALAAGWIDDPQHHDREPHHRPGLPANGRRNDKAAQAAGIKSGTRAKNHTNNLVRLVQAPPTTGANPSIQITVRGPWDKKTVATAVTSLGDSLIAWANAYQNSKIDLLDKQIAVDQTEIDTLQKVVDQAHNSSTRSPTNHDGGRTCVFDLAPRCSRMHCHVVVNLHEISLQLTNSGSRPAPRTLSRPATSSPPG